MADMPHKEYRVMFTPANTSMSQCRYRFQTIEASLLQSYLKSTVFGLMIFIRTWVLVFGKK
jgi:hypothetical protein